MADLQGQVGELKFTMKVTRKETGLTEEVDMVGFIDEAKLKELQKREEDDIEMLLIGAL